jgi:hypothetical protein
MSPTIVLGFVLATLYGLVFYVLFDRGWLKLVFYWIVGVVGFFLGQWLADLVGLHMFTIGETNIIEGTVTSLLSLVAARSWRR